MAQISFKNHDPEGYLAGSMCRIRSLFCGRWAAQLLPESPQQQRLSQLHKAPSGLKNAAESANLASMRANKRESDCRAATRKCSGAVKPIKPTSVLQHITAKRDRDTVESLANDCRPGSTFVETEAAFQAAKAKIEAEASRHPAKGTPGIVDPRIVAAIALYESEDARTAELVGIRKGKTGHHSVTERQRRELSKILKAKNSITFHRATSKVKFDTETFLTYLHGGDEWKIVEKSGKMAAHQAQFILSKRMTENGGRGRPVDEPIRNLLLRLLTVYAEKSGNPPLATTKGMHGLWKWMYDLKVLKSILHKRITVRKVFAAIREYQTICRYNAEADNRQNP